MLVEPLRGGGEIGVAGTHANDQIRVPGQEVGGQAAGFADATDIEFVAGDDGALARLGLGEGNLEALGEALQGLGGAGILHPAAADQQRLALAGQQPHGILDGRGHRRPAIQAVHPLGEEVVGIVVGLALDILGQRQGHGAGLGRIGQHAHGVDRRAHQLLGPIDAVPVLAHRAKGIVGADRQVVELLDLLQHRIGLATGIDVTGQQQQRNAIGGGGGRSGQHVGRARAHRGGAGIDLPAQLLLGETGGGVGHALLIAALVHHQVTGVLLQGLAQAQYVAVTEDGEDAGDELGFHAVDAEVLVIEEFHQGLGHGQTLGAHGFTSSIKKLPGRGPGSAVSPLPPRWLPAPAAGRCSAARRVAHR